MKISILDTVVLEKDLPINGLKKGDIGAVVETYEPDGLEVDLSLVLERHKPLLHWILRIYVLFRVKIFSQCGLWMQLR